ncbi:hypothetical protein [Ornithinibacillus xuwenensis]|uniref:Uncharacterized protein n=1 Tax=Ornithinibacillus xuwenensis TaxID=3144668 RepID=A0ABU9XL84_9BACI
MGRMDTREISLDGFQEEIVEVVHQLGELRDLELEDYISILIKRSDSIKLAGQILHYLDAINEISTKLSEKDKQLNRVAISELQESLRNKSLTPMEKRFLYEEVADLIRSMESIRSYWKQKSLLGLKYIGAASAVAAATVFFRKRK